MPHRPVDYRDDSLGVVFQEIASYTRVPDYVKYASHRELNRDDWKLDHFADPVNRLFPMHTKAATWTSAAYLLKRADELDDGYVSRVWERLVDRADLFGIKDDLIEMTKQAKEASAEPELEKEADDAFALVIQYADGTKERHYPLRNSKEVRAADQWFANYRHQLRLEHRRQIARQILKKASQFQVVLRHRDLLEKSAGLGASARTVVAGHLRKRAYLIQRDYPGLAARLRELADGLELTPQRVDLTKVAEQLDELDAITGLYRRYGKGVELPEEVCFAVSHSEMAKAAEETFSLVTGETYRIQDLAKLDRDVIEKWFGDEIADEATGKDGRVDPPTFAALASTLPRAEAELFSKMLRQQGIRPVAASDMLGDDQRFTTHDMLAIACDEPENPLPSL